MLTQTKELLKSHDYTIEEGPKTGVSWTTRISKGEDVFAVLLRLDPGVTIELATNSWVKHEVIREALEDHELYNQATDRATERAHVIRVIHPHETHVVTYRSFREKLHLEANRWLIEALCGQGVAMQFDAQDDTSESMDC